MACAKFLTIMPIKMSKNDCRPKAYMAINKYRVFQAPIVIPTGTTISVLERQHLFVAIYNRFLLVFIGIEVALVDYIK